MKTLSTYVSDDGKARADVVFAKGRLKVHCFVGRGIMASVAIPDLNVDAAEAFCEDFVSKNNKKKENDDNYSGEPSVLC